MCLSFSLTEQKIMHLYLRFNLFAKPYLEVIRIYSLFCAQEPLLEKLRVLYGDPGIKPVLTKCKAYALPILLDFRLQGSFFCRKY